MSDLVKRLRQGCDCSEKVCEMDTFSELAADRIEELERVRAHDLEQEQVLLKRIEELEASTIHDKYVSAMKRVEELEATKLSMHNSLAARKADYELLQMNNKRLQSSIKELEVQLRRKTIAHGAHLIEENVQLRRKIKAGLKLADEWTAPTDDYRQERPSAIECARQLRETLKGSDETN